VATTKAGTFELVRDTPLAKYLQRLASQQEQAGAAPVDVAPRSISDVL
jgi:hypothetical protein